MSILSERKAELPQCKVHKCLQKVGDHPEDLSESFDRTGRKGTAQLY